MTNCLVDGELLLSGDTLFVDSVGRTELQFGADDAVRGAELLYDTLHETILDVLQLDRETFVERLTEDAPERPPTYGRIIATNTGRETVDDEKDTTELDLGPNNRAA